MYNEKAMLAYEHMKETVDGFNEAKKNIPADRNIEIITKRQLQTLRSELKEKNNVTILTPYIPLKIIGEKLWEKAYILQNLDKKTLF